MRRQIAAVALCLAPLFWAAAAQAASAPDESPHDVVAAIYTREMLLENRPLPRGTAFTTPSLRRKYFSKTLNRLLRLGDAQAEREQGVGPLEFDPVISGQDGELNQLAIKVDQRMPDRAVVSAHFVSFGQSTVVTYILVKENGGWAVDDIKGTIEKEGWSVREILESAARHK